MTGQQQSAGESGNGQSHGQSQGHGHGRGNGSHSGGAHGRGGGASQGRVCVAFTFYKVRPSAFALAPEERRRIARAFEDAVEKAADHLGILRTYSLVGLRPDVDLLFWQAAEQPEGLQRFASALRKTEIWPHLEMSHHYLAMTRRSIYVDNHVHEGQEGTRTRLQPAGAPYLFVYPFIKTRAWYALPMPERQRMMDQHIAVGHKYPNIKINTTYSFGLDDQEFVVAFEGDSASEFLDLVMELRSSEASQYTLRDTPAFTGVAQPLGTALEIALGIEDAAPIPDEVATLAAAGAR